MRMYYVVNARMPNHKAYGIQLAKMCEAFVEKGVDLTLVIPKLLRTDAALKEFYDLRTDIRVVILPALDWYDRGRLRFFLSSLVFMISSFLYLMREKSHGRLDVIYTIDMDMFSFAFLPLIGAPLFSEIQDAKPRDFLHRYFFKRVSGIVGINSEVESHLVRDFGMRPEHVVAAQNAVEVRWLSLNIAQDDARRRLSLPQERQILVYTGRFYKWKGLDVLPAACEKMLEVECYVVGGPKNEFIEASGVSDIPPNLHIMPGCENGEVPYWLAAADVLVVMGTRKNEGAYRYRSPMKTYEYMAMRRPTVVSSAPALRAIVGPDEALFYEPDDADDLARKVKEALVGGTAIVGMVARAHERVQSWTWKDRAQKILALITSSQKEQK